MFHRGEEMEISIGVELEEFVLLITSRVVPRNTWARCNHCLIRYKIRIQSKQVKDIRCRRISLGLDMNLVASLGWPEQPLSQNPSTHWLILLIFRWSAQRPTQVGMPLSGFYRITTWTLPDPPSAVFFGVSRTLAPVCHFRRGEEEIQVIHGRQMRNEESIMSQKEEYMFLKCWESKWTAWDDRLIRINRSTWYWTKRVESV
jgi:hypothetical protein